MEPKQLQELAKREYLHLIGLLWLVFGVHMTLSKWNVSIPVIFGHKTVAMFDLWLIGHLMFGVIVAGIWIRILDGSINPTTPNDAFSNYSVTITTLRIVLIWELIEVSMEHGLFGDTVATWKDGFEHWTNRFIADPLMGYVGCRLYLSRPQIFWPVLALGIVWETAHVLSPNAMSIQEWLF